MTLNKVMIIGNLGADPEIRRTQSGDPIANFSVAVTERWKDKNSGDKREKTEWVRVVCFNKGLAGVIEQYVKKGTKVFVEGKLQTRKWQDQSGNDKYTTEVVLDGFNGSLEMLGGKQENSSNGNSRASGANSHGGSSGGGGIDDEIPF